MLLALKTIWDPLHNDGYQLWSGIAGGSPLLAGLVIFYRHLECHQSGCHRLGRFQHGHYKLCHRHHPKVPDHGKVSEYHINQVKE